MATILLTRSEAEEGDLPPVCMRCGRPATLHQDYIFHWPEWWTSKTMRASVPLCSEHKNHFLWHELGKGAEAFAVVLGVLGLWELLLVQEPRSPNKLAVMTCLVGSAAVFVIVAIILRKIIIRPTEITDSGIIIKGVAQGFVDALKQRDDLLGPPLTHRLDTDESQRKEIRLTIDEAREGKLPLVCIYCGEPAERMQGKHFSWNPELSNVLLVFGICIWPLFLVGAILWPIGIRRVNARVPFCSAHRDSGLWPRWILHGSPNVILALAITGIVLLESLEPRLGGTPILIGLALMAIIFASLVSIILADILRRNTLNATEITDDSIYLINVAPEFVHALRAYRQSQEAEQTEAPPAAELPKPERSAP